MTDATQSRPLPPGCEPRCPACAHRNYGEAESLARKAFWLHDALAPWQDRIASVQGVQGSARRGYRRKTCLTCAWQDGRWHAGMMRRDELIPIPDCPIHSGRIRGSLAALLPALPAADGFPLRYYVQSDAQVTLVLKSAAPPPMEWFTPAVRKQLSALGIEGLWLHLHPAVGRKVFAKPGWQLLWGSPTSRDADGMQYGPTGFQQLIPALYRQALATAVDHLQPTADTAVIDLYSGGGSSLREWLCHGAATIGVELGAEAVAAARVNASGAEILRGKCAQRIPQLKQWLQAQPGKTPLLYVNPPRTGLEAEVITWAGEVLRPRRIAYLSCSAGTLRRDLAALQEHGYQVSAIIPYDFFPQTYHVENLALLTMA